MKRTNIKIKYLGSSELPRGSRHCCSIEQCDTSFEEYFSLDEVQKALQFLRECSNPQTTPSNLSWALKPSEGIKLIKSWTSGQDFQNCTLSTIIAARWAARENKLSNTIGSFVESIDKNNIIKRPN